MSSDSCESCKKMELSMNELRERIIKFELFEEEMRNQLADINERLFEACQKCGEYKVTVSERYCNKLQRSDCTNKYNKHGKIVLAKLCNECHELNKVEVCDHYHSYC